MKPLILERPLCVLDIEATGLDFVQDRILTLAVLRIQPADLLSGDMETRRVWRCHPGRTIPAESTRIHGISNEMVMDWPYFRAVAEEVRVFLSDADLCGYNLRGFDVPMLWEEFHRAGVEWAMDGVRIVDASEIFRRKEPRTLAAALKKFAGREHTAAHDALADVEATWEVLRGEREMYPDVGAMNVAALAEFSCAEEFEGRPARRLDLAGYLIEDADGVARYTLKKVRGVPVLEDVGFAEWMLRSNFPQHTCDVLRKIIES